MSHMDSNNGLPWTHLCSPLRSLTDSGLDGPDSRFPRFQQGTGGTMWDCSVTLNARMPEYATQEWRDFSVKVAKGEIQTVAALLFGEFRTTVYSNDP